MSHCQDIIFPQIYQLQRLDLSQVSFGVTKSEKVNIYTAKTFPFCVRAIELTLLCKNTNNIYF